MSQHLLSAMQYKLLTSQNSEIKGVSEQTSRIVVKAEKMMNTLRIIARSTTLDQEFKDKVFPRHLIDSLITILIQHDAESTAKQESNKQAIAIDLMQQSLRYFADRYKEVFIKKELKTFDKFAKDIIEFTENQIEETRAQELYKTRQSLQPPLLYPAETSWKAVCLECHNYDEYGKNEDEAIKRIRHTKNCTIHTETKRLRKNEDKSKVKERLFYQYFKTIPPVKSKKS